jgi:hypothetical protein
MKARFAVPFLLAAALAAQETAPGWKHLSAKKGDLAPPNTGTQQTGSAVFDIDRDGINDFVITERTAAPAVVWYRRTRDRWSRHIIEPAVARIEAGATFGDVDGDGDLDLIAGGDSRSNEVWWWENPHPAFDPEKGWRRYTIKSSGKNKHHDGLFEDFDGDGRNELVFWNQGAAKLILARVPSNVREVKEWPMTDLYVYSEDSEPAQRASAPAWKRPNEHEGLCAADIDLDGRADIVGGGRWFKHLGGGRFLENIIDAGYPFSRSAAGQLIEGGRPEVLLVVGDGVGPLILYEWTKGTWSPRTILENVDNGHSLSVADFNGDGRLDIFCAEMRLNGGNPDSKTWILLGDGRGNFKTTVPAQGFDNHESRLADLDGDKDLDILGKPYNHETPNLNIFLNTGK